MDQDSSPEPTMTTTINAHIRSCLIKRKPSPRFNPKKHIEKPRRKNTLNANSSHARALGGPEVVSSIGVEHNGCYRGQTCQGQDFESHQGEDQLQWESGVLENCCKRKRCSRRKPSERYTRRRVIIRLKLNNLHK